MMVPMIMGRHVVDVVLVTEQCHVMIIEEEGEMSQEKGGRDEEASGDAKRGVQWALAIHWRLFQQANDGRSQGTVHYELALEISKKN